MLSARVSTSIVAMSSENPSEAMGKANSPPTSETIGVDVQRLLIESQVVTTL